MVVRLPDGSSLKLPRRWTDADGPACTELSGNSPFALRGLRELLMLFLSLRQRYCAAVPECDEKIGIPHDGAGSVEVEALKACGFTYVSLDLEGFRSGSLNESLRPSRPGSHDR